MADTTQPTVWQTMSRHVPDLRGVVAGAVILMVFRILDMIDRHPALLKDQGFMSLAQSIVMSGFIGLLMAFCFAASKTAADKAKADAAGEGGTTINTPPGSSTVRVDTPATTEPQP